MWLIRRCFCILGWHSIILIQKHSHADYIGTCVVCGHQFSLQE